MSADLKPHLAQLISRFGPDAAVAIDTVFARLMAGDAPIVEIAGGDDGAPFVRFGVEGLPLIACGPGTSRGLAKTFEASFVLPRLVPLLKAAADILDEPEVSVQ